MKKIRIAVAFLLIFLIISIKVTSFATDYLYQFSSKITPFTGLMTVVAIVVLLWDKIELLIKEIIILYGDRKKYKQTLRLIKNTLRRENEEDLKQCIISDIEKRKMGLRVVYNSFNFNIEEKSLYEDYKDYYKEVEEHFCNSSFEDSELLAWDFKYIVCEIEKSKHISPQVCEKIMVICKEIIYSNINIKEIIKIEFITCLEKSTEYLKFASPGIELSIIQENIEDALIKLGKKRIASNMKKKISEYKIHGSDGDSPKSDLEYYAWYSSYMTYRKADLSCVQLMRYLRTMHSYYDKIAGMILSENSERVELTKQELRYIIEASQLYEALIYKDESRDTCEELSEIFSDTFEILTKLFIKVN